MWHFLPIFDQKTKRLCDSQIKLDRTSFVVLVNSHTLLPNNVSRQVLHFIWASPPRQISIERRWRQNRTPCLWRAELLSSLKSIEHTRIAAAAAQSLQKGVDGGSLLKFADRHFITDAPPATTGSGKLYLRRQKRFNAIICILFKMSNAWK